MADASEAVAAGADLGLQYRLDLVSQCQIRMSDNAGTDPRLSVEAARAHGRNPIDELGLADGPPPNRPVRAGHGARLDEHSGEDVVAAVQIGKKIIEQITPAWAIP